MKAGGRGSLEFLWQLNNPLQKQKGNMSKWIVLHFFGTMEAYVHDVQLVNKAASIAMVLLTRLQILSVWRLLRTHPPLRDPNL